MRFAGYPACSWRGCHAEGRGFEPIIRFVESRKCLQYRHFLDSASYFLPNLLPASAFCMRPVKSSAAYDRLALYVDSGRTCCDALPPGARGSPSKASITALSPGRLSRSLLRSRPAASRIVARARRSNPHDPIHAATRRVRDQTSRQSGEVALERSCEPEVGVRQRTPPCVCRLHQGRKHRSGRIA
jgi:hypothetical protein